MTIQLPSRVALLLTAFVAGSAAAATSVKLPNWACAQPDTIYASAFDQAAAQLPHDPSLGNGGAYPGSQTRTLHIAGLGAGTQNYYLYVPDSYTPERSWPLMLVLHGVAPYGGADGYATTTRNNWITVANAGAFIVAAPVADDVIYQNGNPYAVSWLVVPPTAHPNDYDLFAAVRTDLEGAYNIERTRIYGWGFSAGGHVMHDLGMTQHSAAFNASTMAAYGVSGADLAALACAGMTDTACNNLLASVPRKIPVDIHIGNSDPNSSYAKSDHLRFVAQGWVNHVTIFYEVFVGGHTYTIDQLGETWTHLCPNAVTP
jgi:poly(3-hydroxybutyrate) depolymerase